MTVTRADRAAADVKPTDADLEHTREVRFLDALTELVKAARVRGGPTGGGDPPYQRWLAHLHNMWSEERAAVRAECADDTRLLLENYNRCLKEREQDAVTITGLRDAARHALRTLECNDVKCWAFTREAMSITHGVCRCASCRTWRAIDAVLPRDPTP